MRRRAERRLRNAVMATGLVVGVVGAAHGQEWALLACIGAATALVCWRV